MSIIVDVYAREVLDSRGNPTVEVEVTTESGALDAQSYQAAQAQVKEKRWSCATATRDASWVRAFAGGQERK